MRPKQTPCGSGGSWLQAQLLYMHALLCGSVLAVKLAVVNISRLHTHQEVLVQ
jgi:hypothetical protein